MFGSGLPTTSVRSGLRRDIGLGLPATVVGLACEQSTHGISDAGPQTWRPAAELSFDDA